VLQMIILALVLHVKGALDFVDIVKFIIHFYATVLMELTPLQIVSSHHLITMVLEMVSKVLPFLICQLHICNTSI